MHRSDTVSRLSLHQVEPLTCMQAFEEVAKPSLLEVHLTASIIEYVYMKCLHSPRAQQ